MLGRDRPNLVPAYRLLVALLNKNQTAPPSRCYCYLHSRSLGNIVQTSPYFSIVELITRIIKKREIERRPTNIYGGIDEFIHIPGFVPWVRFCMYYRDCTWMIYTDENRIA